jgi:adenylate kinase
MGLYLVIMGVQGSGKGTQAAYISEKYGIPHVSTGDLFRAMRTREDEFARKIQDIMKVGNLVSDEDTNQLLLERLEQPDVQEKGVILDGYPRNPAQAEWLEQYFASKGKALTAVLLMELDLYTAFKRAFGRVSTSSGETYNIYYNTGVEFKFEDDPDKAYPPKLDATVRTTGEKLNRRPDDASAHSIIVRIDKYLSETQPLIEHYEEKGLLRKIDADQPIETVSQKIVSIIQEARQKQ